MSSAKVPLVTPSSREEISDATRTELVASTILSTAPLFVVCIGGGGKHSLEAQRAQHKRAAATQLRQLLPCAQRPLRLWRRHRALWLAVLAARLPAGGRASSAGGGCRPVPGRR